MAETDSIELPPPASVWAHVAERFLDQNGATGEVAELIRRFVEENPLEINVALNPTTAEGAKSATTDFLLSALWEALSDHALSDDEMRVLAHLRRLFRVDEGDFLKHHDHDVRMLLCREIERLFEDRVVTPEEAIHKVRLQEALGLSYDQFIDLTKPEIEKVIFGLIKQLDPVGDRQLQADEVALVRRQIIALGTVYYPTSSQITSNTRAGYLYLLTNSAMPGLVKIGRTSRRPEQRMLELASATGVPAPFQLVYEVMVADCHAAEALVHALLEERGVRVSSNREFFAINPSEAVELMIQARGSFSWV